MAMVLNWFRGREESAPTVPATSDSKQSATTSTSLAANDKDVEALLSERLKSGWVLCQLCCPSCATPLVKMEEDDDVDGEFERKKAAALDPKLKYRSKSKSKCKLAGDNSDLLRIAAMASMDSADSNFSGDGHGGDGPPKPVAGIPYCVSCGAHVVTDATEIRSLSELGRMAGAMERGSIIVAIVESGSGSDEDEKEDSDVCDTDDDDNDSEDAVRVISDDESDNNDDDDVLLNPPVIAPSLSGHEIEVDDADNFIEASRSVAEDEDEDEDRDEVREARGDDDDCPVAPPPPISCPLSPENAAEIVANRVLGPAVAECASLLSPVGGVGANFSADDVFDGIEDLRSLPSEEGQDLTVESHVTTVQDDCAAAVGGVAFPPQPVASDLLDESEKEDGVVKNDDESALLDEELKEEYSVRRDVATKVLGAKMLQGYTLRETQCLKCGMPLMEHKGRLDCVVCPVLVKKARKRNRERQAAMKAERVRSEQDAKRARELAEQKAALEIKVAEERRRMEAAAAAEQAAKEEEVAEKMRLDEEARVAEAKAVEERRKAQEDERLREEELVAEAHHAEERRAAEEEREERLGLEEEARLEREANFAERQQARLDEERMELLAETERLERITNEKLAGEGEGEGDVLSLLEAEAAEKRRAAEEAIAMAKAAMCEVSSVEGKVSIAETIKQAEAESVAEVEGQVALESRKCVERQVDAERWVAQRTAGPEILTERMLQGWTMLDECCGGAQCQYSPLVSLNGGKKECVICGGSGSGQDGAYVEFFEEQSTVKEQQQQYTTTPVERDTEVSKDPPYAAAPIVKTELTKEEYDEKRKIVSREVGRRMLDGWVLLDSPCPHCTMPLMSEAEGCAEICLVCGQLTGDTVTKALGAEDVEFNEENTILTPEESFMVAMEKKMADELVKNEAQKARRRAAKETITAEEHARALEQERREAAKRAEQARLEAEAEQKRLVAEAVRLEREKTQREAAERAAAEKLRLEEEARRLAAEEAARLEAEAKRLAAEEAARREAEAVERAAAEKAAEQERLKAEFERIAAQEAAEQARKEAAERAAAEQAALEAAQAESARLAAERVLFEALSSKRVEADMPEDEFHEAGATSTKAGIDLEDQSRLSAVANCLSLVSPAEEDRSLPNSESRDPVQLELPVDIDYSDPEAIKQLIANAQVGSRGVTPKSSPRRSPLRPAASPVRVAATPVRTASPVHVAFSPRSTPSREPAPAPSSLMVPGTPTSAASKRNEDAETLSFVAPAGPHNSIIETRIDKDHDDISQMTGWTKTNTPNKKKYSKDEIEATNLDEIVSEPVVRSLGGQLSSNYASKRLKEGWLLLPVLPCIECGTPLMSPPDMKAKTALCVNENCDKCIIGSRGGLVCPSSPYNSGESTEVEAWNPGKGESEDADDYDTLLEDDPDVIRLQRGDAPSPSIKPSPSSPSPNHGVQSATARSDHRPRPDFRPRPDALHVADGTFDDSKSYKSYKSSPTRRATKPFASTPTRRVASVCLPSPRSQQRGSSAFPSVVGHGFDDNASFLSDDVSRGTTVASAALDTILGRIDDAKEQLARSTASGDTSREAIERQVEMALLIEKLASAAVALKQIDHTM